MGAFQDSDESAHYEFLCRSAGVPIHYCAEQFENDGRMPNTIMKALKRTMAAEYSRELSVKVFAGQRKIVAQGFRGGGVAGYGYDECWFLRTAIANKSCKATNAKNLQSDHVVLVPAPNMRSNAFARSLP